MGDACSAWQPLWLAVLCGAAGIALGVLVALAAGAARGHCRRHRVHTLKSLYEEDRDLAQGAAAIFRSLKHAVLAVKADGTVCEVNAAAAALLGYTPVSGATAGSAGGFSRTQLW